MKLKGAAKAAFLARMNKGRIAAGLKKIASKTKSVTKKRSKKRSSSNSTPRSRGSQTMAKQKTKSKSKSTLGKLYDKKQIKVIAMKTAIGASVALAIRLGTMFFKEPTIRELGSRAASTSAAYLGSGTAELAYQAIDAGISRLILMNRNGNGGNGVNIPNPLNGGA